jgi:hypothetical protein
MAGGYVVEGRKGRWFLRSQTLPCHPVKDDAGELVTFPSKGEALKAKRELERGQTLVPRERSEVFRQRALTRQGRNAKVIDYRAGTPTREK